MGQSQPKPLPGPLTPIMVSSGRCRLPLSPGQVLWLAHGCPGEAPGSTLQALTEPWNDRLCGMQFSNCLLLLEITCPLCGFVLPPPTTLRVSLPLSPALLCKV